MKNRILSVFLVAMMVAGILPIGAYAESLPEDDQLNPVAVQDTDIVQVSSWEKLKTAVEVNAPTDGTLRTIEITGSFSKDGDGINIKDGKNIIIQSGAGGPYTITRSIDENSNFFGIYYEGNSLTLKNIVLDGNGDKVTATSTIIYKHAGSFIMDSGAVIQNSRIDEGGTRAAAVSNLEGDFIMKPGSLIENAENIDKYGSGGVVNIGTFIMEGGSISGSKGALAGGVYNYGNVTIKGGTISGNTGKSAGGILNYMTLSVSGLVNIIGNKYTDTVEACNVYSSDIITVDTAGLDSSSRIGVTMEQRPYEPRPVNITGNNGADYSDNFISDNEAYTVKNSGSGENQVVKLTVPDTVSPFLTAGAAVRTGHTAGSVKFTSNESGSYYYKVVEDGAVEPGIDTDGSGAACTTSETTITDPVGLTAGAKDIYIKVKDASGNVSSAIKIDIAEYTEPDTVSPVLTAGAAVRTGHTAGSVKFTSSESGSYYYKVVEDGAGEPGIDTDGAGVACTTSETTITDPVGLIAGAKDIYIKVKDASGNVSSAIKIDIAAYKEPDISAPFLIAGAAVRTGHTAGSVKFTSNESGSYYYKVVEDGAVEPGIDTDGDGVACTTSETTITDPVGLIAGAKDIYIKVKDASGNISSAIKIDIAAYTEPDISAPVLIAGAAVRTGHTAGSVKFTSNESGSYYYKVVEDGAVEPGIDTDGDGVACTTSETTITDPVGLIAGAKDIYIKVKDASGNISSAIKIDIAAYTEADISAPVLIAGAAVRTGHTAGSVKFTSNESGSYYYKVVEDGAVEPGIDTDGDGVACTTSETTITDPEGLTAGAKDIYIKVKDASGNVSSAIKIDIAAYTEPDSGSGGGSSSGGSSNSETIQPEEDAVTVIVNGKEHNAGKETMTVEGGKTAVTIELNNKVIESKIDEAIRNNPKGTGNVIMVPVADTKAGIAKIELTGDIVRRLESNAFDVSIKRGDIEYVIPAEEFTINKAAENLGVAENDFQDIRIEVRVEKLDEKTSEEYRKAARANGAELIFSPVSFEIVAKTTDKYGKTKDFTVSKFSNYVERIMEIPEGIDKNRITTGIVFNSDGTYSHVPTSVFEKDGRWYARVNSLTNSDYSVIYNAVTVESAEKHWAKDTINDMASRMVLIRPESFEPDKFINRADFAEYIVRALGIYREDSIYENKFNDLNGDKSQTQAILTASEYGIVAGYPDGTFRPEALIIRQEAMAMYQRVMKVTNLTGSNPERYKNYKDFKDVNDWAKSDVKEVLSAHVFNGTSETAISPKSNLTCAEALQAIKNLLVESQLINK